MATDGDVVALGFGSGEAHFVITLGFGAAVTVVPITPANVGSIGNMPDWGTPYEKAGWMQPARYNPVRWRPMRYKKPW